MPTTTASMIAIKTMACPRCLPLSPLGEQSVSPILIAALRAGLGRGAQQEGPQPVSPSVLRPEDRRRRDYDPISGGLRDHRRDEDQVEPERDLEWLVSA